MDKFIVNQEFHEELVELINETIIKSNEEQTLEQLIQDKIDEVYDPTEWKRDVLDEAEGIINDARTEITNEMEDKITEVIEERLADMPVDIENSIKKEIPVFLEKALSERKIDKGELKEALVELKEEFNLMISEQVKHHFNILAGFMIDQFQK